MKRLSTTRVNLALIIGELQRRVATEWILEPATAREPQKVIDTPITEEIEASSWWDRQPGESRQVWRRRTRAGK